MPGPPLLHGLRALDLTDERGSVCGRILADLGADVIKIEPPGGSRERRVGPFWDDDPRPENSLWFLAYNAGKRGVTLDVGTTGGAAHPGAAGRGGRVPRRVGPRGERSTGSAWGTRRCARSIPRWSTAA